MSKQVLILCTGNSCRSQMAQVIWQHVGQEKWTAYSAGSHPADSVHPLAIKALNELGLPTVGLESKSVNRFRDKEFDLTVTVCNNARETCPIIPGARQVLHWPFDDPAVETGSDDEKMHVFRRVRDEIRTRIMEYLSSCDA